MHHNITTRRPWWFWLIAVLFLVWNIIGCGMYLAEQMMPEPGYTEAFGAAMAELRAITPKWATAGYAVGVWFGLAGILTLMLRKRIAVALLTASLIGAVIGFLPYFIDGRFKALLTGGDYGFTLFIFAECIFILWFARLMLRPAKAGQIGDGFE